MTSDKRDPGLGEAATLFLARLPPKEREASQPELYKFARWFGWERLFSQLAPPHVEAYAEQLSVSDTDYAGKAVLVRSFLSYAKKVGWSRTSLATHLKTRKGKAGSPFGGRRVQSEAAALSRQKYDELVVDLETLKKKSQELVVSMRLAAADKDFRENAPLAAAREERGHVEGRIKELEETIKAATIIDDMKKPAVKSGVGDRIILSDLATGEEYAYRIVDPREADPLKGKISTASPLGKALVGRSDGDTVEITAPAGKMRYQIKRIER